MTIRYAVSNSTSDISSNTRVYIYLNPYANITRVGNALEMFAEIFLTSPPGIRI